MGPIKVNKISCPECALLAFLPDYLIFNDVRVSDRLQLMVGEMGQEVAFDTGNIAVISSFARARVNLRP